MKKFTILKGKPQLRNNFTYFAEPLTKKNNFNSIIFSYYEFKRLEWKQTNLKNPHTPVGIKSGMFKGILRILLMNNIIMYKHDINKNNNKRRCDKTFY